jgi:hypothetical protein
MTGSKIGYRGPWGTYYAANVRLEFQEMTEERRPADLPPLERAAHKVYVGIAE